MKQYLSPPRRREADTPKDLLGRHTFEEYPSSVIASVFVSVMCASFGLHGGAGAEASLSAIT